MNNRDTRLWLVKIRSRAVWHNRMLKHTTRKPLPSECQFYITVQFQKLMSHDAVKRRPKQTREMRAFKKILSLIISLKFFPKLTDRHFTTRNSLGDEIANVNLLYDCTPTKNTIDSCINSATDRFLQRRFTKFSEITQCNGHYAIQGHSRPPILVPIESSYTTSY